MLAVLLQLPMVWNPVSVTKVAGELFGTAAYAVIGQAAIQSLEGLTDNSWVQRILQNTPEVLHPIVRSIAARPIPAADLDGAKVYAEGVIAGATKKILVRDRAALIASLAALNPETQATQRVEKQQQLMALEAKIREL